MGRHKQIATAMGAPGHCGSPSRPGRPRREFSPEDGERGESKLGPKRVASLGWLMVAEEGHLVRTPTGAQKERAAGRSASGGEARGERGQSRSRRRSRHQAGTPGNHAGAFWNLFIVTRQTQRVCGCSFHIYFPSRTYTQFIFFLYA